MGIGVAIQVSQGLRQLSDTVTSLADAETAFPEPVVPDRMANETVAIKPAPAFVPQEIVILEDKDSDPHKTHNDPFPPFN